jgi:hypothetical protein
MPYEHIKISRDEPIRERHPRKFIPPNIRPADIPAFVTHIRASLAQAKQQALSEDIGGFDTRLLLKVNVREGLMAPALGDIPGITVVSQEDKSVVLTFATGAGLAEFESRLVSLTQSGKATREAIIFAIQSFDRWTPENRKGAALMEHGLPNRTEFFLDVELWPMENPRERTRILDAFIVWAQAQGFVVSDRLSQPSLILVRLRANATNADLLLSHRDIRTVDLPPRMGLAFDLLTADVNQFPLVPPPPENAPRIAVLDSGITAGHPLLSAAIGDAQGFVAPGRDAADMAGHGTFVSGLALYGDVAAQIRSGQFIPQLLLFSGRVFNDDDFNETTFVEKSVEEAVRYFLQNYQCRVFNLSYGDMNKVYDGRHVRGLAYTLDRLSRELGVLFVVPTGNLRDDQLPVDPIAGYPDYLLEPASRMLDPAPALNAITVGGLATLDATADARRNEHTIEDVPIAKPMQPSPFTRSGMSVGDAVKPDFVEEAGNAAFQLGRGIKKQGLGIVSMNAGFATGRPFRQDHGTSFAAPKVAHMAARLAHQFPDGSANLVRAILACHAAWTAASVQLLNPTDKASGRDKLMKLVGYGRIAKDAVFRSTPNVVTLYADDQIESNRTQFFEIPLPTELWGRGKRHRKIAVALAYSPEMRTTRLDYRHTKLTFKLIEAESLEVVADAFTKGRAEGLPEYRQGGDISETVRKAGTLQASSWSFTLAPKAASLRLFVVVTRQDSNWSMQQDAVEPYALSIVISDRENETVNLYERVSALVQARAQTRERARART